MNYEILSGDILVAVWKDNILAVKNEALLPLFLKRISNADIWLESGAIDSHRANSRLLKKALRLTEKEICPRLYMSTELLLPITIG